MGVVPKNGRDNPNTTSAALRAHSYGLHGEATSYNTIFLHG